ncbi:Forkhead box protein J3 [Bagarius yarrelli]|uniref:Forkhead box protein J3 n=1 Tax=Bagarius yarrelli TaxID=175774 RepID=A0A556V1P6_BAGYA|nr:Forkhead box protein J3 [Bagarius yarrelli]
MSPDLPKCVYVCANYFSPDCLINEADATSLLGIPGDIAPLHTPTLPPLSPQPCPSTNPPPHMVTSVNAGANFTPNMNPSFLSNQNPQANADSDRLLHNNVIPADRFSSAESLRESFRIASGLDWSNIDLTNHPDLLESMRQAELCDWALDPAVFNSLCDSLNRFFTHRGIIGSTPSNLSSLNQMISPLSNMHPVPHLTLAHLTQPSPLSLPPQLPHCSGTPSVQSHRKTLTSQSHSQNSLRNFEAQPAASVPLPSNAIPVQPLTPRNRPPMKQLHSNSEEIQDDFDWDSLIV